MSESLSPSTGADRSLGNVGGYFACLFVCLLVYGVYLAVLFVLTVCLFVSLFLPFCFRLFVFVCVWGGEGGGGRGDGGGRRFRNRCSLNKNPESVKKSYKKKKNHQ